MKKTYKEPLNKTEIINTLAEDTQLSKKEVKAVLDSLGNLINAHVCPRSAGVFKLPGMMKIQVIKKPATKAKKGVPNPFRPGETMDVAAKPASKKIKVIPLKQLKDMAS
ncbi:MAG: DNA-binding protein [Gammaproteobacteria bacterium]|nr:DNA-binding protein [Gammaproteobacteria bacterium]